MDLLWIYGSNEATFVSLPLSCLPPPKVSPAAPSELLKAFPGPKITTQHKVEEEGWSSVSPPTTPRKQGAGAKAAKSPFATPSPCQSEASDASWERVSQFSSPAEDRELFGSVKSEMKYVLVSGGVVSGIGKGLTASSIGVLFKSCGWRCTSIKIDPYVNCDAGTMSPFEHGEVYVLNDGGEVDLDLGNYERFLDVELCRDNNITTGKIFKHVIEKEPAASTTARL